LRKPGSRITTASLLLAAIAAGEDLHWYKGNIHAHSTLSDGDSAPEFVAEWYKKSGYHFLCMNEHNMLAPVDALNAKFAEPGRFLLIPGEEVTDYFEKIPVHYTALLPRRAIEPAHGASLIATIQNNLDAIRAAAPVAILNHPKARWAMTAADLLKIRNLQFIEVFNGHPMINTWTAGASDSPEEIWDALLTAGRRVYAIAADDAHNYREWKRENANPGKGWICVRAVSLEPERISLAMIQGNFYASTGVELSEISVTKREYRLKIVQFAESDYTTYFIGPNGRVLARVTGLEPVYKFRGNEFVGNGYVRARVEGTNGDRAWTQPLFPPIRDRKPVTPSAVPSPSH
jgi:hypothetical protein